MMDGILVIRKEKGFTSHDVVAKLRGILHMKKIGHTGTLDPEAEGVLPIALGKATRLVELLTDREKSYEAVMRLGVTTDTQDMTGTVQKELPVDVSEEKVREVLQSFLGAQQQIPPMYSALKVGGEKLCDLARKGKVVERQPRPVFFHEICVSEIHLPFVRFSVTCSKGTYIRTLCHDAGEKLGCGGCMESLVRTRAGRFTLDMAHTLSEVEAAVKNGLIDSWIFSIEEVLGEYPALSCKSTADRLLKNGNPLSPEQVCAQSREGWVRMYDSTGDFVGVFQWKEEKKRYDPVKMFAAGQK